MRLEDQVPKLEYCQRLKELGVGQKSALFWLNMPKGQEINVKEGSREETLVLDKNKMVVVSSL